MKHAQPGIELRPFIKDEHAVAVWQADNEAFRDHWGSHDRTYEEWSHGKIGLGVDSANLTGAARLYQRAGMYVAGEFAMYEKELRTRKEG